MWKGVPFEEVAASRDIYMSFIVPRTGVVFVPVLASPDWTEVRVGCGSTLAALQPMWLCAP